MPRTLFCYCFVPGYRHSRLGARVRVPRGVRTTFPRTGAHALVALRGHFAAAWLATRLEAGPRGARGLPDTIYHTNV